MPPTKSIRLSVRGSPMPRIGPEHPVLQQRHVERARSDRAGRSSPRRAPAGTTRPSRKTQKLPGRGGLGSSVAVTRPEPCAAGRAPRRASARPGRAPRGCRAGCGAASAGKSTARNQLYSSSPRCCGGSSPGAPGPPARRWRSGGARRPRRHAGTGSNASSERPGVGDPPDRVPHAVGRGEVVERRGRRVPASASASISGRAAVGEEHRLGVGAERQHVAGAVVLLVRPGLLVLPDDVALVVVDVHAADHAGLRPPVHDLPVEVERRLGLAEQRALGLNRSSASRACA